MKPCSVTERKLGEVCQVYLDLASQTRSSCRIMMSENVPGRLPRRYLILKRHQCSEQELDVAAGHALHLATFPQVRVGDFSTVRYARQ